MFYSTALWHCKIKIIKLIQILLRDDCLPIPSNVYTPSLPRSRNIDIKDRTKAERRDFGHHSET